MFSSVPAPANIPARNAPAPVSVSPSTRTGTLRISRALPALRRVASTMALALAVWQGSAILAAPSAHAADAALSLDGETGQFTEIRPQFVPPAAATFRDGQNNPVSLADFKGKVILANVWATWCVPCVAEMPSLNKLAGDYADAGLAVVPISIDQEGALDVVPFYRKHNLENLGVYVDPQQQAVYSNADHRDDAALAIYGLPITYALDRNGKVLGYITGRVDWQSQSATEFVKNLLKTG